MLVDGVSSQRPVDRSVALQVSCGVLEGNSWKFPYDSEHNFAQTKLFFLPQRLAQSGVFLATSEMVLFQLTKGAKVGFHRKQQAEIGSIPRLLV